MNHTCRGRYVPASPGLLGPATNTAQAPIPSSAPLCPPSLRLLLRSRVLGSHPKGPIWGPTVCASYTRCLAKNWPIPTHERQLRPSYFSSTVLSSTSNILSDIQEYTYLQMKGISYAIDFHTALYGKHLNAPSSCEIRTPLESTRQVTSCTGAHLLPPLGPPDLLLHCSWPKFGHRLATGLGMAVDLTQQIIPRACTMASSFKQLQWAKNATTYKGNISSICGG